MILDSSAVCAIVLKEAEALAYSNAASEAESVRMAAPTFVEAAMVIDGKGRPELTRSFDEVLDWLHVEIAPFTERQARLAREAFRDFGRGSGHRARLNLGDCFAYALAKDVGEPLLYKGDDFVHTDVRAVFPRGYVEGVSPRP
ncbi:MAG TPA: type II toxin-antitoxin system VapC family toxin [Dermatophilaceae bacterium]|uniref:Ribonuclease VapC n=1 Tax=Candidatus Phosphoribacter hodrii TaxID=2953743 RepID=A0A934X926_9MICO|nr:type II toxin-antitoxin system VapC family toxin [Candidatus Phosphoribacter hodrii]MBP8838060.1 type II toxin-antitoxin system VapC family toxin [Dermatophilaceae bacterium]OPZ56090.1 MAG: Ribonuclease VapC28 [bacterium ADurb.BinA028]HNV16133.1 type II toxin-antitoxin system VapC family toxin [Dermatophilaceae bacterium]HOA56732.1 type II toxin-antitoxin system VapC family toxin [Dermatophilaceae bacterium]